MSTRSYRTPSYRHHKASRQAVVTIDGRDHYLGLYGLSRCFSNCWRIRDRLDGLR